MITKNITSTNKLLYGCASEDLGFPFFQRGYVWKNEQVEKTLFEIANLASDATNPNDIYLLNFVWYKENQTMKIADGQQRFMTLQILMICINEYLDSIASPLPRLDYFNFTYEDTEMVKKYYKFFDLQRRATAPFANMYQRLSQFVQDNAYQIEDIIRVITTNVYGIFQEVENADAAYEVFTQINSGGKPLSKDDIIKTAIKQASKKYGMPVDKCNFKEIKTFIRSYYKLKHYNNEAKFDNFAIMTFISTEITKNAATFKAFCNYIDMIREVNKLPIYHVATYLGKDQLINVIYALSIKGIDLATNREYITKVLFPLSLMSTIWKFKKVNPGGKTKALFPQLLKAINDGASADHLCSILVKFITENEDVCKMPCDTYNDYLGKMSDTNTKKALIVLDIIRCNTSGNLNMSAINLEHIFPVKPVDEWIINGWSGNSEEQAEFRESIGNYMLLSEAVNKKIQAGYITDKVVEYNRIIPLDKILQTDMNIVDFARFENEREKYIYERQKAIAKSIQNNFPFGKMLLT